MAPPSPKSIAPIVSVPFPCMASWPTADRSSPVNWSDSSAGRERRQAGLVAGRAGALQVDGARPRQRADLHRGTVGHVQAGARVDLEQGVGEVHRGAERDRAAGDLERLEARSRTGDR